MDIIKIENCTRILAAPIDWDHEVEECHNLPIFDVDTFNGHYMVSAWMPTADELAALNTGESIKLWVMGSTDESHPVVSLSVGELK